MKCSDTPIAKRAFNMVIFFNEYISKTANGNRGKEHLDSLRMLRFSFRPPGSVLNRSPPRNAQLPPQCSSALGR